MRRQPDPFTPPSTPISSSSQPLPNPRTRSGAYALYANGVADDEVFFTASDILCSHSMLASGGLSALTEGLIGVIAVPLCTLPRRGVEGQQQLGDVALTKILTKRFKVMNVGTDHRSAAAVKELRFLQGSGAGSKLSLDSVGDATWSVLPWDSTRVFVVRTPPALAQSLLGPFTAHVLAALNKEPLLQKLREHEVLNLSTLEAAEATLTSMEDHTKDVAARAAAVLGAAVGNIAAAFSGTFASTKGASKRTQQDNTFAFIKEADAAVAVVKRLFARPDSLLGDLAAELKKAKGEELPSFLRPAAAVPPPQSLIPGASAAMSKAVSTRARSAQAETGGAAKGGGGGAAKARGGGGKAEARGGGGKSEAGGDNAAKKGAKRGLKEESETRTPAKRASFEQRVSPPTEPVAAMAAAALGGDRGAVDAIMGGTSPLAPAESLTPAASAEMQAQVKSLRDQLQEKSTKLELAELRIQELSLELGQAKGELSGAIVDKQQLGQLQGQLTVSCRLTL